MTPARKAALKFFDDWGKIRAFALTTNDPSDYLIRRMLGDKQLQCDDQACREQRSYSLTDAGRRALWEAQGK